MTSSADSYSGRVSLSGGPVFRERVKKGPQNRISLIAGATRPGLPGHADPALADGATS